MNGSFRQLVQGGKNGFEERQKAAESLQEEHPLVAEALCGSPASGSQPEVSAGTIAIWLDGRQAKFSIFVKGTEEKFFGTIVDIANPWGSINSALLTGEVSRKRHTERVNGLANPPY